MSGYIMKQRDYALALKKIPLTRERAKLEPSACTAEEKHELHTGIGGLLFLCYTRMDLVLPTILLQSHVHAPVVRDIKDHNSVVEKAHLHCDRGLVYQHLQQPTCLAAISDASGSTKKSSYAIEGRLACRKKDRLIWGTDGEIAGPLWNGLYHVLSRVGKKSKRVG